MEVEGVEPSGGWMESPRPYQTTPTKGKKPHGGGLAISTVGLLHADIIAELYATSQVVIRLLREIIVEYLDVDDAMM